MLHPFFPVDDRINNQHCCIYILELPDAHYPYLVCCARGSLYRKTDCNCLVLYGTQSIGSIYLYAFHYRLGSTDYRDQMLLAPRLRLNGNPHTLLENLLLYDLDLLCYYNLSDDKINNLSVYPYIRSDDTTDNLLLYVRLLMESLYSDD